MTFLEANLLPSGGKFASGCKSASPGCKSASHFGMQNCIRRRQNCPTRLDSSKSGILCKVDEKACGRTCYSPKTQSCVRDDQVCDIEQLSTCNIATTSSYETTTFFDDEPFVQMSSRDMTCMMRRRARSCDFGSKNSCGYCCFLPEDGQVSILNGGLTFR